MSALTEFLYPSPARRSALGILGWWERRRLGYNLFVGAAGTVTLFTAGLATFLPPFSTAPPDAFPWGAVVVFAVGANVFYTLGAVVEWTVEKLWGRDLLPLGPTLYRMGLTFSVGLALFPTLILIGVVILGLLGIVA